LEGKRIQIPEQNYILDSLDIYDMSISQTKTRIVRLRGSKKKSQRKAVSLQTVI